MHTKTDYPNVDKYLALKDFAGVFCQAQTLKLEEVYCNWTCCYTKTPTFRIINQFKSFFVEKTYPPKTVDLASF